jgi:anti-sigma B factor antagonist
MKIDVEQHGAVTVVRPEDRLDIVGYLELEDCLAEQLEKGRTRLVLDLEEATFINSSAMGVMSRFWADCARVGGVLLIARPSREARNFLRLGDLDDLIEVYSTVEEAVKVAASRGTASGGQTDPGT